MDLAAECLTSSTGSMAMVRGMVLWIHITVQQLAAPLIEFFLYRPCLKAEGFGPRFRPSRVMIGQCGVGNLIIGVLNYLHGGLEDDISFPSAAHQRVSSRMEETLRAHVLTDEPILSPMGVDAFLKQTQHYTGCGVVLALGVKGGVPQSAATVPLADHLRDLFPMMSRQVECPDSVLLSVKHRPKRVKRGYTWLASSYPELVKRNVKAGLHKLKSTRLQSIGGFLVWRAHLRLLKMIRKIGSSLIQVWISCWILWRFPDRNLRIFLT